MAVEEGLGATADAGTGLEELGDWLAVVMTLDLGLPLGCRGAIGKGG